MLVAAAEALPLRVLLLVCTLAFSLDKFGSPTTVAGDGANMAKIPRASGRCVGCCEVGARGSVSTLWGRPVGVLCMAAMADDGCYVDASQSVCVVRGAGACRTSMFCKLLSTQVSCFVRDVFQIHLRQHAETSRMNHDYVLP